MKIVTTPIAMNNAQASIKGFTLLELLVAMSIFALISVMAYTGLNSVMKARLILEQNMDRLNQIQKTMLFMTRDFNHIINRSIRDEYGTTQAAILQPILGDPLVEFTRTGYPNPLAIKRSNLQRIAYRIEENTLYRQTWQVIDRAQDSQPYQAKLCDKVSALQFRYLDNGGSWHEQWPPANSQSTASPIPKAIEITLELEDWGMIKRLLPMVEV